MSAKKAITKCSARLVASPYAIDAQCLHLATSGGSGNAAGPTALPLKADLQAAMSASPPILSASPPGADLPGDAPVRLVLTRSRPWGDEVYRHEIYGKPVIAVPFHRCTDRRGGYWVD